MDSSPSTLRIMARGIYRTVLLTVLRPCLCRRPLSLAVYFFFRRTYALTYKRITITVPVICPDPTYGGLVLES
jgi:hypothetical protein